MKALIIGFGSIGKRHYRILSDLLGQENVFVVSRRDIGIKNHFLSIEKVSALKEIDYFVIASTTIEHSIDLELINTLVDNKIILVEKPLFNKVEKILDIKNKIFVAYNLRFHPLIIKCSKLLLNEKVISARFYAGQYLPNWRPNSDYRKSYSSKKEQGGGILLDYSHDLDLIYFLLGKVKFLEAFNNKISNLDITSDDYLSMIGTTENKICWTLTLDSISKFQKRNIQIDTDSISIDIDLISNHLKIKNKFGDETITQLGDYDRNDSFIKMHKLILENEIENVASYRHGLLLMNTFELIKTSSNNKKWL